MDFCPQRAGWLDFPEAPLRYNTPAKSVGAPAHSIPLLIWLHGAGEGGDDLRIACLGNKVVNLSSAEIQGKLGGAAYVLVPQCPTVWMDNGSEQLYPGLQTFAPRQMFGQVRVYTRVFAVGKSFYMRV